MIAGMAAFLVYRKHRDLASYLVLWLSAVLIGNIVS